MRCSSLEFEDWAAPECTLRSDRWRSDGSLAHLLLLFVDTNWYVWSKHWSDIISGRYVVLSVLTFATLRSNANLDIWTLVKSFEYCSCKVKQEQRVVLYVEFQLTLTQDIVPDDNCTHDMSTNITRLYSIVESRHQFHPIEEFLMSSCLHLIHSRTTSCHPKDKIKLLTRMTKEYLELFTHESNVIDNNHVLQVFLDVRKLIRIVYFFIYVTTFFFDRHFQTTTYFLIRLTESRVRTDFSSWFSLRVICATSIGPFVTHITLDFFRKRRTSLLAVVLMISI